MERPHEENEHGAPGLFDTDAVEPRLEVARKTRGVIRLERDEQTRVDLVSTNRRPAREFAQSVEILPRAFNLAGQRKQLNLVQASDDRDRPVRVSSFIELRDRLTGQGQRGAVVSLQPVAAGEHVQTGPPPHMPDETTVRNAVRRFSCAGDIPRLEQLDAATYFRRVTREDWEPAECDDCSASPKPAPKATPTPTATVPTTPNKTSRVNRNERASSGLMAPARSPPSFSARAPASGGRPSAEATLTAATLRDCPGGVSVTPSSLRYPVVA